MNKEIHTAIILVGGYGTRLRPLTLTRPKPLIDFANKPMIFHQIEALVDAGVNNVILAVSYQSEQVEQAIKIKLDKLKVNIIFSYEPEPLGTAGAIVLAKKYLINCSSFIVLNSDVICSFPFKELIHFHEVHDKEGTIVVTIVKEPSKYGVAVYDKDYCIKRFVEKPQEFLSNKINAGVYIFNQAILNRIQLKPTSIEKDIFPAMVDQKQLMAFELQNFWMDIGQPQDYITGMCLYLQHLVYVKHSAILGNTIIRSNSWIDNCIVGWNCSIGKWVRMEGTCVLGENVTVTDEVYINGGHVLPYKNVMKSILNHQIIM